MIKIILSLQNQTKFKQFQRLLYIFGAIIQNSIIVTFN